MIEPLPTMPFGWHRHTMAELKLWKAQKRHRGSWVYPSDDPGDWYAITNEEYAQMLKRLANNPEYRAEAQEYSQTLAEFEQVAD